MNDALQTVSSAGPGGQAEGREISGEVRHTLPKRERLSGRNDIERLFTCGEAFLVYPVKCTFRWSEGTEKRVMVIVPKRNHRKAVVRNRLKRLLREAYRLHKHRLSFSAGADIALSYIAKGEPADYRTVEQAVVSILNKLCTIRNEKTTRRQPAETDGGSGGR